MIIVLKLNSCFEVNSLAQVILVAVEEYHVDISMELRNKVITILVNFLLNGS